MIIFRGFAQLRPEFKSTVAAVILIFGERDFGKKSKRRNTMKTRMEGTWAKERLSNGLTDEWRPKDLIMHV